MLGDQLKILLSVMLKGLFFLIVAQIHANRFDFFSPIFAKLTPKRLVFLFTKSLNQPQVLVLNNNKLSGRLLLCQPRVTVT